MVKKRPDSDPVPDPKAGGEGPPVVQLIPPRPTLKSLASVAKECRACRLHKTGTQTVFGEGPSRAQVMFVGEQPGDAEDIAGQPFVGPAGKLLDRALADA
jgi:uracil-DNA glycosylase